MESEFLPTKPSAVKLYKHFSLDANIYKEPVSRNKTEFFYLGKNRSRINFLIKTFESGYAAESVENAISVLKRIEERHSIPDVIFIDAVMGEAALRELHSYLAKTRALKAVPVVLEASGLAENDLRRFKSLLFLDEIFFLDDQDSVGLITRIKFLKNAKKRPPEHQNGLNIQTGFHDSSFDWKNITKRVFDIIVSLLAIIILSPVFLLIALAIKFESGGPVLYVSQRAGRGYKIFNFFKFRTMVPGADEKVEELSHLNHYNANENTPVFFKVFNDSRITRIGAFLRSTSMDELPQFFNVLLGDMSLVGNRPLPLYEAAKLTTDDWAERFMAPAGITGLWQIKKRRQGEMSMEDRIRLDIVYSHKYNFMYDLWIIAHTPSALIQKSNA